MDSKRVAGGWVIGVVCVVVFGAGVLFFSTRPDGGPQGPDGKQARLTREQTVEVGGVRRPVTDVSRRPRPEATPPGTMDPEAVAIGRTPKVPARANVHVKASVEALTTGTHPERVSSLVVPGPFDKAAYLAEPDRYLNVVEPGRVWQVAQPGRDVPRLASLVNRFQTLEQGQTASLLPSQQLYQGHG